MLRCVTHMTILSVITCVMKAWNQTSKAFFTRSGPVGGCSSKFVHWPKNVGTILQLFPVPSWNGDHPSKDVRLSDFKVKLALATRQHPAEAIQVAVHEQDVGVRGHRKPRVWQETAWSSATVATAKLVVSPGKMRRHRQKEMGTDLNALLRFRIVSKKWFCTRFVGILSVYWVHSCWWPDLTC